MGIGRHRVCVWKRLTIRDKVDRDGADGGAAPFLPARTRALAMNAPWVEEEKREKFPHGVRAR
jgi:hypothetical protein